MQDELSKTIAIKLTINGSAHDIIKHKFQADIESTLQLFGFEKVIFKLVVNLANMSFSVTCQPRVLLWSGCNPVAANHSTKGSNIT